MAIQLLCDGCNAVIPESTIPHGYVRQAHYCDACEASVAEYECKRDELHTKLAARWEKELTRLRRAWLRQHKDGRLPDE